MDLKDFNNSKIKVENNSFLLLSSHRNDYFNEYSEKISNDNPDYKGYILSDLFFSEANIEIVQRFLVLSVYKETNKKYLIPFQNHNSITTVMKYMFNENAKNLPYDITKQINELNTYVVTELKPMIIKNIYRREQYIKDINAPPPINNLPINVNSAGNKTLPSYSSTFI
jgi:hypothetical protein